jgi:hypothetical protein
MACAYTHDRSVSGCVYSTIVSAYWLMTRCVFSIIICIIIYIQSKLLVVTTILISRENSYYTGVFTHCSGTWSLNNFGPPVFSL